MESDPALLSLAVCIATHNRRGELARTFGELVKLRPGADAVWVAADGCSDGTGEWVREAWPGVRLVVHERARGSVESRNELAERCGCDLFVSLDDDSYPLDVDFVERVRAIFVAEPRLAVLTFPQRTDERPETLTAEAAEFGAAQWVGSYVNSGAVVRRAAFLELGGYTGFFFHAYEEPDFALRCVAAGWQVRYEPSLVIRHHFTWTGRNETRTHQRHARNELWSALLRCPAPWVFAVVAFRVVRQLGYARRRGWGWVWREPAWWLAALRGAPECWRARRPLPWRKYRAWMRLVRRPLGSAAEWEAQFGSGAP